MINKILFFNRFSREKISPYTNDYSSAITIENFFVQLFSIYHYVVLTLNSSFLTESIFIKMII